MHNRQLNNLTWTGKVLDLEGKQMERIPIGQTLSMMKNPFLVKMAGTLDSINSIVV